MNELLYVLNFIFTIMNLISFINTGDLLSGLLAGLGVYILVRK